MFLIEFIDIVIKSNMFLVLRGWSRSKPRGEGGSYGSDSDSHFKIERTSSRDGFQEEGKCPFL